MTLIIDVEFLHGPSGLTPTASPTLGECRGASGRPPRLGCMPALIAADGTGARCRVTDGTELEFSNNWILR